MTFQKYLIYEYHLQLEKALGGRLQQQQQQQLSINKSFPLKNQGHQQFNKDGKGTPISLPEGVRVSKILPSNQTPSTPYPEFSSNAATPVIYQNQFPRITKSPRSQGNTNIELTSMSNAPTPIAGKYSTTNSNNDLNNTDVRNKRSPRSNRVGIAGGKKINSNTPNNQNEIENSASITIQRAFRRKSQLQIKLPTKGLKK